MLQFQTQDYMSLRCASLCSQACMYSNSTSVIIITIIIRPPQPTKLYSPTRARHQPSIDLPLHRILQFIAHEPPLHPPSLLPQEPRIPTRRAPRSLLCRPKVLCISYIPNPISIPFPCAQGSYLQSRQRLPQIKPHASSLLLRRHREGRQRLLLQPAIVEHEAVGRGKGVFLVV